MGEEPESGGGRERKTERERERERDEEKWEEGRGREMICSQHLREQLISDDTTQVLTTSGT